MPIALLPSFLFTMIVVGYTPGPANLYSLACCLKYGRRKSLKMWRGLLCGFSLAACIMVVLTHILGEIMGQYVVFLKYIGAAYILWLAWKLWRSKGKEGTEAKDCSFLSGFMVQFTNAKMLLFELTAFSVYVLPYSHSILDLFVVAALLLIAGPLANLAWLYAGAYLRRFFSRYRQQVDIVMALLLAACAVYIIVS